MSNEDPIKASIAYLEETGWTKEQAKNLLSSLTADTAEGLWELAPQWVEYCGNAKKILALLESVALGPLVRVGHDGTDWTYALRDGVRIERVEE